MTTGLVGQDQLSTFTSPVNGVSPIDANTVKGNDNTIKTSFNTHDADPSIHFQSSTNASRPSAATAGTGAKWLDNDTYRVYYSDGSAWHEIGYVLSSGGTITGNVIITGTCEVDGNFSVNTNKFTVAAASGNTLVAGTLAVTSDVAVNTNKFTVTASSGNTLVAGTLGVTGALTATTGAFSSTLDVQGLTTANAGLHFNGPAPLLATMIGYIGYESGLPGVREYIGDGTGYSRKWSKRVGSVTTDLMSLSDAGATFVSGPAATFAVNYTSAAGSFIGQLSVQRGGVQRYAIGTDASDLFTVTNAAGNLANLSMTDAGVLTIRGGLTVSAGTSTVSGATTGLLNINSTSGATSDVSEVIFQRGGANKWRIGTNIDGANADVLNLYNDAGSISALKLANTTGAATFVSTITGTRLIANADISGAIAYGVFTDGTAPANNGYAAANVLAHLVSKASALTSGTQVTSEIYHKQTAANSGSVISAFSYIDAAYTSGTTPILIANVASVEATGNGGTTTTLGCYRTQAVIGTGATVTTLPLVDVRSPSNSGTIGTLVGVDIQAMTAGSTNNFAIRTRGNDSLFNGSGSALATNATVGFIHAPNCAGTPTGTPANLVTGATPIIIDTSAGKLWAYYGAAWHFAAFT